MTHRFYIIVLLALALSFCAVSQIFAAEEPITDEEPVAEIVDFTEEDAVQAETAGDDLLQADSVQLSACWGKKIDKIVYSVPPWMSDKEIKRLSKIKAGRPLSLWRVRKTMQRIYLLGYIENIEIRCKPRSEEKVAVRLAVYPKYVLRDIELRGSSHYSFADVNEDILHISSGDDFFRPDLIKWEKKLVLALNEVGFLDAQAKVEDDLTDPKVDNKADILISLKEHKRYKITNVVFDGDITPYTEKKLLTVMRWRKGMKYKEVRLKKGLERLEKYLKKKERLEARIPDWDEVKANHLTIDKSNRSVVLHLKLNVGPKVDIDLSQSCFTCQQQKWKIPKALALGNQRRFNKWIVKDWANKIENFFKERGFYNAECIGTYDEKETDKGLVKKIVFKLDKGNRIKIRSINFKNNPTFSDRKLESKLEAGNYFTQDNFDASLESLVHFYNQKGFLRAKILEKRLEYVEKDGIHITIVMDEGPQTILKTIEYAGATVYDRKHFEKMISKLPREERLIEGKPLNPFVIEGIKARIIASYMRKGYIKSRVKDNVSIVKDDKEARVIFEIKEGKRYKFAHVYIHGNKLTKKQVIRRELFIKEGRPFDYEKVFDSEQALAKLGLFSSIQIRPVNLDLDNQLVDLIVEVKERNSGYVETEFGYNTYFGYSIGFEVGHKNLAGYGRKLSFYADVSMKDEEFRIDNRHVAINFVEPWLGVLPIDGKITIFENQEEEIGYDLRSFGVVLGVETVLTKLFYNLKSTQSNEPLQKLFRYWSVGLEYEYARDFIFNLDEDVDAQAGEIQITTLSPSITRDERNNPFNPTGGIKNLLGSVIKLQFIWSEPSLLSEINYLQVIGQTSVYWGMFKIRKIGKLVLAQNFRVGYGKALRMNHEIPISRRFYLGGSTTVRGFGQDEIAPLADDGETPVGGNALLQSNTELRIPLPKSLGLLAFFDAGDVTKDFDHFYFDLMRTASGIGFRYMTPIGPISADYGIKLNRLPRESFGEFYITIGNAF